MLPAPNAEELFDSCPCEYRLARTLVPGAINAAWAGPAVALLKRHGYGNKSGQAIELEKTRDLCDYLDLWYRFVGR